MQGRLALFDLDNTLLAGDSDHAWGEFLIERGLVDADRHRAANDAIIRIIWPANSTSMIM